MTGHVCLQLYSHPSQRLMWGKSINCGQTCIAPDYILCHAKHLDKIVAHMKATLRQMFGDDQKRFEPEPELRQTEHSGLEWCLESCRSEGSHDINTKPKRDHTNALDDGMMSLVVEKIQTVVCICSMGDICLIARPQFH